jgi:hypothetical protein
VIVPSRTQPNQQIFLTRAIRSIAQQGARSMLQIEVIVGLDTGERLPELDYCGMSVRPVRASSRSQAAALNAAAAAITGEYIAFLEDDDQWHPQHIDVAIGHLAHVGFISGTQLEVAASGAVIRINDFATPSGWVMSRSTWEAVGPFNEGFRYHLDNEWLGRLAERAVPRVHVVESTAPVSLEAARAVRPWLANVLLFGGKYVALARHTAPVPLVLRLVHNASGMARIIQDKTASDLSAHEIATLQERFGRIPW